MKTRRQRQQSIFAALLAAVAIVNVLFFLILYRPARSEFYSTQQSIENLQKEIEARRGLVERFEKLSAQLDNSEQDRLRLVQGHFTPYDGFSHLVPQLTLMAEQAGVEKTQVNYNPSDAPQFGLYSVKIDIPVQGSYSSIVNFIKAIENSETLFVIESINIQSADEGDAPAGSQISLSLNLETFFYK